MKYTGVICEKIRNKQTREIVSGSSQHKEFKSKSAAKKWIRDYVKSLGGEGFVCDMFSYEIPSYVTDTEPPFNSDEEERVVIPYYFLGDISQAKNAKPHWY